MPSRRSSRARRHAAAAALLVAAAASGCGGGDDGGGGDGVREAPVSDGAVVIREFAYEPETIVVAAGTEVRWRNDDEARHTATANGRDGFDTGTIEGGETGSARLDTPGRFAYVCDFHAFMKGVVEVR